MGKLPLNLLQHFVAVARHGNLSRAAAQAHLTVSALSHQMRQLEQRLDRRLLLRGPRGVQLTADGRQLLEALSQPFEAIEQALAVYRQPQHATLTINSLPAVISSWLVPRLPQLLELHPTLELNLQSSTALVDFSRERVDAALRYGRGHWPGLHSEHLFDEWIAPVAAPGLIERMAGADPSALGGWPLLGDPSDRWRDWFEHAGGGLPTRYVAQFDRTDALQQAAQEGLGVALGRMVMARPLIASGRLVVLGERQLRVPEAYYLVYPERSLHHPGLQAFRQWLHPQAAAYREQLPAARLSALPAAC